MISRRPGERKRISVNFQQHGTKIKSIKGRRDQKGKKKGNKSILALSFSTPCQFVWYSTHRVPGCDCARPISLVCRVNHHDFRFPAAASRIQLQTFPSSLTIGLFFIVSFPLLEDDNPFFFCLSPCKKRQRNSFSYFFRKTFPLSHFLGYLSLILFLFYLYSIFLYFPFLQRVLTLLEDASRKVFPASTSLALHRSPRPLLSRGRECRLRRLDLFLRIFLWLCSHGLLAFSIFLLCFFLLEESYRRLY